MSCTRQLSITITEDMPLHSAVYESGRDFIYAVRGGTVFKLNATNGNKISSSRFGGPDLSDSYICYDSGRDKLWVTYSPAFRAPPDLPTPINDRFIYKLNVDTFAIEQTIGIDAQNLESSNPSFVCNNVIRHIRSNGVQLAFATNNQSTSNGCQFVVFDPDNLPGALFTRSNIDGTGGRWPSLEIRPGSTDYLLCTDDNYNDGVHRRTNADVFVESGGGYPVIGFNHGAPFTARIYGFAYVSSSNKHYCANRSNLVLKLDASAAIVGTAIDTGRASADIWNIRLSPLDGKLYAPTFSDNAVAVIDPASGDAVTVKTGFDSPWDVVFTNARAFAVQHSAQGLKEIV